MTIQTHRLISMVRIAMHRNRDTPLIHSRDPDILTLDEIILSHITEVVKTVHLSASSWDLRDIAHDIGEDTIYWHQVQDGCYSGHILLPDDFLRLSIFEMSDWRHHVEDVINYKSAYYAVAQSQWAGIKGTPYRPVCMFSPYSAAPILEFHSCLSNTAQIVQAKYVATPRIDADGGIEIAETCLPEIIRRLAQISVSPTIEMQS